MRQRRSRLGVDRPNLHLTRNHDPANAAFRLSLDRGRFPRSREARALGCTYGGPMTRSSNLWGKGGGRLAVLLVTAALLAVAFGASWADFLVN